MRVTVAQHNPIVGDIDGNVALILDAVAHAQRERTELLVTSELAVVGYPPRDLVLRKGFAKQSLTAVERIAAACTSTCALVGFVQPWPDGPRPLRNAVAVCRNGAIEAIYAKRLLPTYDVFDEDRYFTPGTETVVVPVGDERVAVLVCEDLWRATDVGDGGRGYRDDPVVDALVRGATTLAVLSASPFIAGKDAAHHERLNKLAARGVHVIAVNQVGGNDDLVFDGRSRVVRRGGETLDRCAAFASATSTIDLARDGGRLAVGTQHPLDEVIDAIVLGIRDYLRKTGHREALIGLSGGIDSAIVATLASIAIGGANVTGVLMPSRYSSKGSIDDALDSARRLRLKASPTIPIEAGHAALRETFAATAYGLDGVPDENLQSRLRGAILMAISNATGAIVLTTGNKSEYAVGYATIYGDMNGGLAPIGDVLKTTVYAMARRLNERFKRDGFAEPPIPESSITKAPSAELRPDQTDQESLPPYKDLDAIVAGRIERELDIDTIAAESDLDRAVVERWCRTIDRMQYKRDQAAVILKVSARAFGRGRPMPIAMR